MTESLRLVTSFDELRAGMVVVDVQCGRCCRSKCTGLLIALEETKEEPGLAWEMIPDCNPGDGCFCGIDAGVVAKQRIYRVVDDILDAEERKADYDMGLQRATLKRLTKPVGVR